MSDEIPAEKLVPILAYWDGRYAEQGFTVWRCPSCGSIGERGSLCPGHSRPMVEVGAPNGLDRVPVKIPMPGDDLRKERR